MFTLNRSEYIDLLSKMIGLTEQLQNKPPQYLPNESLIATIVKGELADCPNVTIDTVEYTANRPNLIIKYGSDSCEKSLGFIGSHMDVVPADPSEWKHNPFELTVDEEDDNILWGRGTTDCLGHVALLVQLIKELSKNNVKLDYVLGIVLISDEECGEDPTIGITHVANDGHLDFLKNGPVYWLDSSDAYPTVGSMTGMAWELEVVGKKGHSGMPHQCINPIMPAFNIVNGMLKCFKENFPLHEKDIVYNYETSSSMKPTQLFSTENSVNQIPEKVKIRGDVRLSPFYDWRDVQSKLNAYIVDINSNHDQLPKLHENFNTHVGDDVIRITLSWLGEPYEGIACDMKSIGFTLIHDATKDVLGDMHVTSCSGSLPLINDLQKLGFDMQIIGYGVGKVYHAKDEYCTFSGMSDGYDIIMNVINRYNDH